MPTRRTRLSAGLPQWRKYTVESDFFPVEAGAQKAVCDTQMSDGAMKKIVLAVATLGLSLGMTIAAVFGTMTTGHWSIAAIALPAIVATLFVGYRRWRKPRPAAPTVPAPTVQTQTPRLRPKAACEDDEEHYDAKDPDHLAARMLRQGRYALLLRPQVAANLRDEQAHAAMECLDEAMGVVPEGDVLLQSWRGVGHHEDGAERADRLVHVDSVYLDRYPVTNRQYYEFVADRGYENMSLWDRSVWPAVLDFVDRTGHPGPRFWQEGCFPDGREDHPVVGISWYECAAYARWIGKRLPSDPEWVKAGCWPVLAQGTRPMQRRYPWGDTLDRERAHVWGSGVNGTISVHEMPDGVSVGGIYHLIGNVWEWTTSSFGVWDTTARKLETPTPMKSIRGGAFDTYFDTQAMCQFQSGESPINRKHNIGFRCALAVCDVISGDFDEVERPEADLVGCGANGEEELQ